MQSINEVQNEIIEEFALFSDWMDKYEYLIDLGKKIQPLDDKLKKDEFLIPGCQSRVWLVPKFKNGKIFFKADSDAIITKGLASLVLKIFNNRKPDEIINSDLFFIKEIGLSENLSPTRANGLSSMIDKIYSYSKKFKKN